MRSSLPVGRAGRIRFQGALEDFLPEGQRSADVVLRRLPPEAALTLEERFDARVGGQGDRIEVRVPEKVVPEVLRIALDVQAEIHSVTPHRVSLETIFLSAVQESAAEDAEAGGGGDAGPRAGEARR